MQLIFVILGVLMPIYGSIWLGWSVGTLIAVIAIEHWAALGLLWLRIRRHESLTGDPLHRTPEFYRRLGKWEMPAGSGRFAADFGGQSAVAGMALFTVGVMMAYLYSAKNPQHAARMIPQWDEVAIGAAAVLACAVVEAPMAMRNLQRMRFVALHGLAMRRYLAVAGSIVLVMLTGLLAKLWNDPLVLLLALIAVKAMIEMGVRSADA
jgi:hypothetical protein